MMILGLSRYIRVPSFRRQSADCNETLLRKNGACKVIIQQLRPRGALPCCSGGPVCVRGVCEVWART